MTRLEFRNDSMEVDAEARVSSGTPGHVQERGGDGSSPEHHAGPGCSPSQRPQAVARSLRSEKVPTDGGVCAPIGYIVKMFPRLSETFILNEILELERQGLRLHIFSLKRPSQNEAKLAAAAVQAKVTYLPERVWREPVRIFWAQVRVLLRHPIGYLKALLHVLRGREFRSLGRGLRRFCQTCCMVHEMREVQHLHAHFASDPARLALWARKICNVSYSITTHAKDLYQDSRISAPGLHYKLNQARFIVANSDYSAEEIRAQLNGRGPAQVYRVYNSIDLTQFSRRAMDPKEPMILSVGRLVEKKGFQDLLKACRILKDQGIDFKCEIIGSGAMQDCLKNSIQELDLEDIVRLRGQMPRREVYQHYLGAMVFALPCVVAGNGDRDILPNVLKEAMAVSVPVVTTRLAGIEELIAHEQSGLLVPPGDTKALANAIRRLLQDPSLRRRLSAEARKVIEERFDLSVNFARLRELLVAQVADCAEEIDTSERMGNPVYANRVYHR